MASSASDRFLSVSEAAEFLSVSRKTVYRRIEDGSLLARQDFPRGKISIPKRELMNFA